MMAGFGSLSARDEAAMSPETYVNPLAKGLVGGVVGGMATLPKRAIEAAQQSFQHNFGPTGTLSDSDMAFFKTDAGFGSDPHSGIDLASHPMMQPSGEMLNGAPLLNNDLFRIVHDYFGHIKNGYGFRAAGEDNAWRAHAAMYSDLARPAMTTETRGQNSWVNYGPHGEANRTASGADTIYADQKVGLMPEWTMRDRGSPEPIIAYHGSPYSFDKFDPSKIGAGEGNQAYGHGLYFAGHSPVSEWYRHQLAARRDPLLEKYGLDSEDGAQIGIQLSHRGGDAQGFIDALKDARDKNEGGLTGKALSESKRRTDGKIAYLQDPNRSKGAMYQVAIDHPPENFMDWDSALGTQPFRTRKAAQGLLSELPPIDEASFFSSSGQDLYNRLSGRGPDGAKNAASRLQSVGIPGIKYLDQHSRSKGTGSSNYVTFDAPRILKKYTLPGAIGAGGFGSLVPGEER